MAISCAVPGRRAALLVLALAVPVTAARPAFEPGRAALELPAEVSRTVRQKTGFGDAPLGYTAEQMAHYPPDRYRLRTVENCFRDAEKVARFSGNLTDAVLAQRDTVDAIAAVAFGLLDARAAREFEAPADSSWGLEWVPDSLDADGALAAVLDSSRRAGVREPMTDAARAGWRELDPPTRRLVARILVAAAASGPLLEQAWDEEFLARALGKDDIGRAGRDELYRFAVEPWSDSAGLLRSAAVDAIGRLDYNWLACGGITFLRGVRRAVQEWQAAPESLRRAPATAGFEFRTFAGTVRVLGPGPDTAAGAGELLVLDLGGDDLYSGIIASTGSPRQPLSLLVDLGGNDRYDSGDEKAGLACGLFGVGALFDLAGNDSYRCRESGIGRGLHGLGLVADLAGDDRYDMTDAWGQGAAHAGVGLLVDVAGDDEYLCAHEAQGFGSTMGVGLLADGAGDDRYSARAGANESPPFWNYTVSFAQGAAFGRRADFGDGHSLAGGIGALADGAGDDEYSGSVYCQGAGYWWAIGILEDKAGNDKYRAHWYSLGSAPHFAIGCCVDLEGDDEYNIGNDSLVNQLMGCGRDGSIGVFIDGSGNDRYRHHQSSAGSGDLGSIGLFWDRAGDDEYHYERTKKLPGIGHGHAITYSPFRNFRDDLPSVGVFLDTQGRDSYRETIDPELAGELKPLLSGGNRQWRHDRGPRSWGFGWDTEWFRATGEAR